MSGLTIKNTTKAKIAMAEEVVSPKVSSVAISTQAKPSVSLTFPTRRRMWEINKKPKTAKADPMIKNVPIISAGTKRSMYVELINSTNALWNAKTTERT